MFFSASTRRKTNIFDEYSLLIGNNAIAFLESVRLIHPYPVFFIGYWVFLFSFYFMIFKESVKIGIGYNTQKKRVFRYGYWV